MDQIHIESPAIHVASNPRCACVLAPLPFISMYRYTWYISYTYIYGIYDIYGNHHLQHHTVVILIQIIQHYIYIYTYNIHIYIYIYTFYTYTSQSNAIYTFISIGSHVGFHTSNFDAARVSRRNERGLIPAIPAPVGDTSYVMCVCVCYDTMLLSKCVHEIH